MEELNGVMIYWLISVGLLVGLVTEWVLGYRSMGQLKNVLTGAMGTLVFGIVFITAGLSAPLLFAAMGTLGMLFLANAFSVHPIHEPDARIERR
ncbi:MAG: hypothetical protein ACQER4_01305 [Bacteroidota bacterium]